MGGCLHGFYQLIDLSTSLSLSLCYSLSLSVSLQRKYKVTSLSRSPSLLSSFCFAIIYLYFNPAPPLLVPVSISPALFFFFFFTLFSLSLPLFLYHCKGLHNCSQTLWCSRQRLGLALKWGHGQRVLCLRRTRTTILKAICECLSVRVRLGLGGVPIKIVKQGCVSF